MDVVVNVSENWGIGFENRLLVCISADLRRFREITTGKTVILGRKTLATFPGGKPLKNRRNIVLTHDRDFAVEGAETAHDLHELFSMLSDTDQVCVIGGASIYGQLLEYCSHASVTKSYVNKKADCFFPDLDELPSWKIEKKSEILEENGVQFQYIDYVNISPKRFGE